MKNMKNRIQSSTCKVIGKAALRLGDFDGGSTLILIDEPVMPTELIEEQKRNNI